MAHDANFVNDRLRLTAFLRVVEQGMPPRPSRFKRRAQVLDEPAVPPVPTSLSRISPVLPVLETRNEPSILGSSSLDASRSIDPTAKQEVALNIEPPQFYKVQSGVHLRATSIYNITHSPTPTELCLGQASDYNQDGQEGQIYFQQQRGPLSSPQNLGEGGATVAVKVNKVYGKTRGSSSTRKRCLPVNELALLRTTTSDGLPDPGVRSIYKTH
jgi:hypothetical protein